MGKILLVEDQLEPRTYYERTLKGAGHDVDWTDATEVAIDYLRTAAQQSKPYDLVVLDIVGLRRKPWEAVLDDEGLRLLKIIRRDNVLLGIPVIGITMFLDRGESDRWEDKFRTAGGNEFFFDYPDPLDFIDTVNTLLEEGK